MDSLLSTTRAFSPSALLPAAHPGWVSNGSHAAKACPTLMYKSKFFLRTLYLLWNHSQRAILPFSFRLDCLASSREVMSHSKERPVEDGDGEQRGYSLSIAVARYFLVGRWSGNRPTRGGVDSKYQREGSIRGCCHLSTDRFFH